MRHHTKDKGDIGVACAIADLMKHDIDVALPLSEHLPFDLVAIHPCGRVLRVSVKYRVMDKTGALGVETRSMWADRNGTHYRQHKAGDYDALAVYCPNTDECYYLLAQELSPSGMTLRITRPRNNQVTGVRLARTFRDPGRLFEASAQLRQAAEKPRGGALSGGTAASAVPAADPCTLFALRPGQESNPQSVV